MPYLAAEQYFLSSQDAVNIHMLEVTAWVLVVQFMRVKGTLKDKQ